MASWSAGCPNRSTGITALGLRPSLIAVAIPRLSEAVSMLNVTSSTSTNTGGAECKRRTEYRIAAAHPLRHQHHQQRVGAARTAHDMLGATEGRKLGLKLSHFGAVDELAMAEHARNRLTEGFAEPVALRGDVDEGDWFGTQMLVHGAFLQIKNCTELRKMISRRRGAAPCGWRQPRRAWRMFPGSGWRFRGWRRPDRRSPQVRCRSAPPGGTRSIQRAAVRPGRRADGASNSCRPA